jgi:hypothetical protein
MRNYQWRKYKLECIIKRKLKIYSSKHSPYYYSSFTDVNGFSHKSPLWINYLNTHIHYNIISYNTHRTDSKYKSKYSPNRSLRWRDKKVKGYSYSAREVDKILFKKILTEYGYKHLR